MTMEHYFPDIMNNLEDSRKSAISIEHLLTMPAVGDEEITFPLTRLFPEGVEFVQSTVTKIESGERRLKEVWH